jgi:hypothetical protein
MRDLFARDDRPRLSEPLATFIYLDEKGSPVFKVDRFDGKKFYQSAADGLGGWKSGPGCMSGVERVPYRLPELLASVERDRMVFVVEGEKDCETLARFGLVGTTSSQGAGKWPTGWGERYFKGRRVTVLPDHDDPGRAHAEQVAADLHSHATEVRVVHLPDVKDKGDVSDYLVGHSVEELKALVLATPPWENPPHLATPGNSATPQQSRPGAQTGATPPASGQVSSATVGAPALAHEHDILARLLQTVEACGLIGEQDNAQFVYLALSSRLQDKPVSLIIKGHTSTGKSYSVETVVRFFPKEAAYEYTVLSDKALVYTDKEFVHKCIVLYEASALDAPDSQLAYIIRSLLSEGCIKSEATVSGGGRFGTQAVVKEGPTNLILTTTKTYIHPENETRAFSLTSDDSREQTRGIVRSIFGEERLEPDLSEWITLQEWLEGAEHRVVIPYASALGKLIEPMGARIRRDAKALRTLIETHAILHQLTRDLDEQGRIVATLADYEAIRRLVAPVIAEGVGAQVREEVRKAVEAVEAIQDRKKVSASTTEVAQELDVHKSTASRHLHWAADDGYLVNMDPGAGTPDKWVPGDPLPPVKEILPTVAELQAVPEGVAPISAADQECCSVAPISTYAREQAS